jgi:4-hydroxythreonine-4-phosphate dehydrogenase
VTLPSDQRKPLLAVAIGDPAGIGPELAARLIADPEVRAAAELAVVGDARVLRRGAEVAGVVAELEVITDPAEVRPGRSVLLDLRHLDPDTIAVGVAAEAGGRFALDNFRAALKLAAAGQADAVCFTPFNKAAMRMAHPPYDDEISFVAGVLDVHTPAKEFNILDGLWNARVTSHVAISAVPALITRDAVLRGIMLTDQTLRGTGLTKPRIGVAALNPHAGDGGNFGHEDDDEIRPAVEDAKAQGINAEGPYPSDTVFVRATRGAFDAVLTMYHDQGQIAMKLLGFDRGVTLLGGFPFPICTPAHGSAYDIAGKGVANIGASRAALLLAAKMAGK